MAIILDGKVLSKKVKDNLKIEVEELHNRGVFPKLAVIMIGDDPASCVYVRNKSKACNEIGIEFEEFLLREDVSQEELLSLIDDLNSNEKITGILLQAPIPEHLNINKAFERINPKKDVDGFNPINVGKLAIGLDAFVSCTPNGIMKFFEEYNIDLEGKNVVIVGRSNIVGKPMLQCVLSKNATVTICHSKTKNLAEITKGADVIISAVGKANVITADMVKDGVVVIDVGINRLEDGHLVGDVDFENVSKKASFITPVPGGVGPMTIASLMENVVKAAKIL